MKGKCPGCGKTKQLTTHHIIPQSIGIETRTTELCRKCHNIADIIAKLLYSEQTLTIADYKSVSNANCVYNKRGYCIQKGKHVNTLPRIRKHCLTCKSNIPKSNRPQ
jgi:hypothetical protein